MTAAVPMERPIPAVILIGGAAVMAISLLAVASARNGLAPRQPTPVAAQAAAVAFHVVPAPNGHEQLVTVPGGRVLATLIPKGGDFLPTLFDKLAQERALRGAPAGGPYRLVHWADGRASLIDPETGRELHLESFGSGNEAEALALVAAGQGARSAATGGAAR